MTIFVPYPRFLFSAVAVVSLFGLTANTYHQVEGFAVISNVGSARPCVSSSVAPHRNKKATRHSSSTALRYRNETSTTGRAASSTSNTLGEDVFPASRIKTTRKSKSRRTPEEVQQLYRQQIKQALAKAAIEDYDMEAYQKSIISGSTTTVAEDLMKELETVYPWPKPAQHPLLNARWSFVFTGVPTIGMRLITLLSRVSVGFSKTVLEFDNVFLEVSQQQSQVKAIVRVEVLGQPVELNVFTKLRLPTSHDPNGVLLIESFDKLVLMGVEIPTPDSWKSSRELQITYLDEDMMIARTAGGEPHLLLRHSPCSTDDDSCDLDEDEPTPFFQDAMAKYGRHLSRSLVDRAYSMDDEKTAGLDVANILYSPNRGGH
eukprot:CAMPEP_0176185160 /NCGR_PEP_ID=MMETSP0121_2-20121125/1207_1 /TAXON_ID=160619 /ORGANISM="Kryptoperidinium foliaceum, Strain CCMP 1326" /LENGTH=373 /DNA_ID=CAMNT_0017523597 /DNA_START=38 /DNA_END=1159 /DNA_ORIENTATION=-